MDLTGGSAGKEIACNAEDARDMGLLPGLVGLRPQGPCRVGTGESGLVVSEEGNPAGLSSCSGGLRPLVHGIFQARVLEWVAMSFSIKLKKKIF